MPRPFSPLAIVGLVLMIFAPPAKAGVFNPETFTLDNGMRVVVISNHRAPVVTQMVWYKVGSADEPRGLSGIAHFLEHLMFKGTRTQKAGEFSREISRRGGRENAFTSYDYTGYFQTIAKEHLPEMMRREADRMTNLVLTPDVIEPERQVVHEERRSRIDNDPGAILSEHAQAALFRNHPYRIPIIGWKHEIDAISQTDLVEFYERWYRPNNAILVVAGDVTAEEFKPLAEKYYGVIPAGETIERDRTIEPAPGAERRVVLKDARVRQPSWGRRYLAPSTGQDGHDDVYPLQVLADIIGGGASSRLYRSLVIDQKLAVSAGGYYSGDNLGPGQFGFYASPRPGVPMDRIEAAIDGEIAKVIADGVTEDELERSIRRLRYEAVYARDSASAGARLLGAALASGQTIEDVESWPERIAAVTTDRVKAAAVKVFNDGASVTTELLPKPKEAATAPRQPKTEG